MFIRVNRKESFFKSLFLSVMLIAIGSVTSLTFAINQEDEAIDFSLVNAEGELVTLSDYKGQAVIINFWATWCPPCIRELPILHDFVQDYPGLPVLLLSPTDESQTALAHIEDKKWTSFTGLYDESLLKDESKLDISTLHTPKEVADIWRVRGQPVTIVLDTEGFVVSVHQGNLPLDSLEVDLLFAGYEEATTE